MLANVRVGFSGRESRAASGARGLGSDEIVDRSVIHVSDFIGWVAKQSCQDVRRYLEIAHRAPRGTLCLVTALARRGLTDIIPPRIDIALPRGSRTPALRTTIDVHLFARETFDLGREEFTVGDKLSIGIYSPERTLTDVIRLRHREGSEIAWETLRRWLAHKGSKPAALLAMAKHFHGAERAVRDALEIVL